MIKVKARSNESVEQMLKRFKKLCDKEGLVKEMKRVMYYEKPSERKRRSARNTATSCSITAISAANSSTSAPREVLIRKASGFILRSAASSIR